MAKNVNNAGVGAVPTYAKTVKQQRERIAELEEELNSVKKTCRAVSKCYDQEAEHNAELAEEVDRLKEELELKDKIIVAVKEQSLACCILIEEMEEEAQAKEKNCPKCGARVTSSIQMPEGLLVDDCTNCTYHSGLYAKEMQ